MTNVRFGIQMMRLIFVSEQKRWEATQARAAATISTIYEEDELEFDGTQDYELPDQAEQAFGMNYQGVPRPDIPVLTPEPQVPTKTMIFLMRSSSVKVKNLRPYSLSWIWTLTMSWWKIHSEHRVKRARPL